MIIETKFDLGQTVYVIDEERHRDADARCPTCGTYTPAAKTILTITETKIVGIDASIGSTLACVGAEYTTRDADGGDGFAFEEHIFATYEDAELNVRQRGGTA